MNDRVGKTAGRPSKGFAPGKPAPGKPPRPDRRAARKVESLSRRPWLVATCIAGGAASLALIAALFGILGSNATPNDALAAISPIDQRPAATLKSDMGEGFREVLALAPQANGSISPEAGVEKVVVIPERDFSSDTIYPGITTEALPYGDGKTAVIESEIAIGALATENITTIVKTPPPEPVDETIRLAGDETLIDALVDRGVTGEAAQALVAAIEPIFPARLMKPGTAFELTLDQQQDFYGRHVIFPVRLAFSPGPQEAIVVEADEDGAFSARLDGQGQGGRSQYAEVNHFHAKARVGSSLYASAKDQDVPDYITAELMRVFSYDVDLQRQVKATDSFEVFYGNPLTGSSTRRKVLHYAQLMLGGVAKTYYRFTAADGQTDYYDETGQSAQKALLKTPVSGARLTSGFGMRRHPLLGYSKMHTGVDFGVPYGTPIRAAGSGEVEIAGRSGAYGICVKLGHTDDYETLYAHMSRLARGIQRGARVNQGQVIGYVGSTGRSTGPHLHYEVRVDDRPVNPTRVKAAGGRQLAGRDLVKFRQLKTRIAAMMITAPSATEVAEAGEPVIEPAGAGAP